MGMQIIKQYHTLLYYSRVVQKSKLNHYGGYGGGDVSLKQ